MIRKRFIEISKKTTKQCVPTIAITRQRIETRYTREGQFADILKEMKLGLIRLQ